jgi:hypothetical protein
MSPSVWKQITDVVDGVSQRLLLCPRVIITLFNYYQPKFHFHQSHCKKPRVRPLDPSHYGQSPKVVVILNDYFLKKAMDSRRKFGSDMNGNPNYGREAVGYFH